MSSYKDELNSLINENFDLSDRETLKTVANLEESDKSNQLLTSLTSKLYDKIVEKVDDIDFGTIPKSKGDITKVQNFEQLNECLEIIRDVVKQYGQDTEPIDVVFSAISNIREREKMFNKAYVLNVELPIVLYNTIVLSIISSISFLIATSIEFIKNPADETYSMALDKVAYTKTSNNLLFENLRKFNVACVKGEVDRAIDQVFKGSKAGIGESTAATILFISISAAALITLSKSILPILQELVYFFYHSKQTVADYFAIQSELIQMNTNSLVYNNDIEDDTKSKIIAKQSKIADFFKKISNKFDITYKKSQKETEKSIKDDTKKYKVSDLTTTSLF